MILKACPRLLVQRACIKVSRTDLLLFPQSSYNPSPLSALESCTHGVSLDYFARMLLGGDCSGELIYSCISIYILASFLSPLLSTPKSITRVHY